MKRLIAAATLLLLAAFPAVADEGFAVGVSAVDADINIQSPDIAADGNAGGARLFGRYQFTKHFGIEGGYASFDRPDGNALDSALSVENSATDLYATGTLPLSDKFRMFGKAGAMRWRTETEESETAEYSVESTQLALGIGGEYELNDRFILRGEYVWTEGSSEVSGLRMMSRSGLIQF